MRILIITTGFPRFKGDLYGKPIYEFSKRMALKDEITVIAPADKKAKKKERVDNINIIRFNYFFPFSMQKLCYGKGGIMSNIRESWVAKLNIPFFMLCFAVKVFFEARKNDIIHANWIATAFIALVGKYLFKKPLILTVRNTHLKDYPVKFALFVLTRVDHIISPHPDLTNILKSFGLKNVSEIPNAVDFENFRFTSPEQKAAQKIKMNFDGRKIVLFNARFDDWKNPMGFVDAAATVLKKVPSTKFIMLGDGIQMSAIKNRIKELGIEQSVTCKGFVTDVYSYTAAADVFVSISKVENIWSNTIIEAILSGLPCVLSKAGYTEKIFKDNETAILVNSEKSYETADGIIKILKNQEEGKRISGNAANLLNSLGFSEYEILLKTRKVYLQAKKPKNFLFRKVGELNSFGSL